MSTQAQVIANQANAQHSTGPRTPEGRAALAQNNFRHGFTGTFRILPCEKQDDFDTLLANLRTQHQPATNFEGTLVEKMAQHFWLAQRALALQDSCFSADMAVADEHQKQLALYLRYQTTHDRAFHKCAGELRNLRNESRKAEIGFESQERKRNEEARKEAAAVRKEAGETRKKDLHEWAVLLAEAKFSHQQVLINVAQLPIMLAKLDEETRKQAA